MKNYIGGAKKSQDLLERKGLKIREILTGKIDVLECPNCDSTDIYDTIVYHDPYFCRHCGESMSLSDGWLLHI